jgi:hypothetical protein
MSYVFLVDKSGSALVPIEDFFQVPGSELSASLERFLPVSAARTRR